MRGDVPVAATLTGWTGEAARGRPLDEVFHIINETTRQAVESPVTKVLREDTVIFSASRRRP